MILLSHQIILYGLAICRNSQQKQLMFSNEYEIFTFILKYYQRKQFKVPKDTNHAKNFTNAIKTNTHNPLALSQEKEHTYT